MIDYKRRLYYEDMNIGDEWTSPSVTITETHIVNFAGVTLDFSPVHMDREAASRGIYKDIIAHGLLVASMSNGLCGDNPRMASIALLEANCKFLLPARINDTITVISRLTDKTLTQKGDKGIVTFDRSVMNQRGEKIVSIKIVEMVERRI